MAEDLDVIATAEGGVQLRLEAVLGRGERAAAVVAPPHPLYGGRLDNPVVVAIARGLERAGVAALRFNFRGTGESDGVPTAAAADADADFGAALGRLEALHPGPYFGAGYSFGAATAVRAAARAPELERLLLVAPPVGMLDLGALRAYPGAVSIVVGDDDAYAPIDALERALAGLQRVNLQVLDATDHFFGGADLDRLAELIAAAARV